MRIGYLRFNLPIELDYLESSSTSLGTDLRLPIIDTLIKQGHDVKIFSPIKDSHQHVLEGKGAEFNYDNFRKVYYAPFSNNIDVDVLLIESAQGRNTMFRYNHDGVDTPFIARTFEVLHNFKGKVFYYHHGNKDHVFPFYDYFTESTPGADKWNLRVFSKNYDIFTDKEWHFLYHTQKAIEYHKFCNRTVLEQLGNFVDYKNISYIPMCYSENFDKRKAPKREPSRKLLFVGSEKNSNRKKKVTKFYSGIGLKTNIIGKWKSKLPDDINQEGVVKGHGKVYDLLNDAYACIQIADKEFEQFGQAVTRPIQVIRSGCILLADAEIAGMEDYLDKRFLVRDKTDVIRLMNEITAMSYEERVMLNVRQNLKLKEWGELDWEKILC